jgi:hypothetical protein
MRSASPGIIILTHQEIFHSRTKNGLTDFMQFLFISLTWISWSIGYQTVPPKLVPSESFLTSPSQKTCYR